MFKSLSLPIALASVTLLGGCATYDDGYRSSRNANDWGYYDRNSYDRYGRYDWNNADPAYNGYYADRYYRADRRYRTRNLSADDRVYRGQDGRYYCRRSDGTTGLIVGGIAGGVLGNIIAPGDSKTLGTVLGAIGGAAAGAAIDSRNVRCN
ncbi:glycine zipper 2TM domain-containing protein [Novosphingobium sp.]|uniref:glycine zipper 2TM domain-containing protein n=1 Tax=Novosphingobium sp. TaxID=1874826 RepID=UPI00286D98E4|nr:glycine zipper 2TM domain-containing protein [Novosphingobium sp.]